MATSKVSYEFLNAGGEVVRIVDNPAVLRITESGVGHCEVEMEKIPAATRVVLAWHGIKQKHGDQLAGVDSTIEDVVALRDRIYAGVWTSGREGGGGLLAIAVSRCKPEAYPTPADAAKRLGALNEEQKKALGRDPKIVAMLDVIRAERRANAPAAASVIDTLV